MAEFTLEVVRIDGDKVIARVLDRQVDDGEYLDVCPNYGPETVPVPACEHWDVGSEVELEQLPDWPMPVGYRFVVRVGQRRNSVADQVAARAGQLVAEHEMKEWGDALLRRTKWR